MIQAVSRTEFPRAEFDKRVTECVKTLGRKLQSTTDSRVVKMRIEHITQITLLDWERGIFKIEFDANGSPRYQRLSKERGQELRSQDKIVQEVVSRVSEEIMNGMGQYHRVIGLEADLHAKLQRKFENPDAALKKMIDDCGVCNPFNVVDGELMLSVWPMKNKDHFNLETVLGDITSPDQLNYLKNQDLLGEVAMACTALVDASIPPKVTFRISEAAKVKLREIQRRYQDPTTRMADQAQFFIQNLHRNGSPAHTIAFLELLRLFATPPATEPDIQV